MDQRRDTSRSPGESIEETYRREPAYMTDHELRARGLMTEDFVDLRTRALRVGRKVVVRDDGGSVVFCLTGLEPPEFGTLPHIAQRLRALETRPNVDLAP